MFNSKKTFQEVFRDAKNTEAFTIVELIVIVVILAILAIISFMSFSSHSGTARDSVRLSDTSNIRKGLESNKLIAGSLPRPSDPIVHRGGSVGTGTTTLTISQGTINNRVLNNISAGIKDPSGSEYGYSVFSQSSSPAAYYQISMELENQTSMSKANGTSVFGKSQDIMAVFADKYDSSKITQLKGNYLFDPSLPSLFILSGSTSAASGGIFNPDICFLIDRSRINTNANKNGCLPKNRLDMRDSDGSLIGYWDMESFSGQLMRDISGNGNDGIITGGVPGNSTGVISRGTSFAPLSYISIRNVIGGDIGKLGKAGDSFTVSAITNLMTYSSGATIVMLKKLRISSGNPYPFYMYYWNSGAENLRISVRDLSGNSFATAINELRKGFVKMDLVIDREKNEARHYINGRLVNSENISNIGNMSNDEDIIIGNNESTPNVRNSNGIIDDVKIYRRALTELEISQQAHAAGFIKN